MGGITHHANGRRQPFSDSTTRGFRGETVTLVDTGVVDARPTRLLVSNMQRRPGAFHATGCVSFRPGAFDAVGDRIPVPQRAARPQSGKMRPHAQDVPGRGKDAMWTVRNGALATREWSD